MLRYRHMRLYARHYGTSRGMYKITVMLTPDHALPLMSLCNEVSHHIHHGQCFH